MKENKLWRFWLYFGIWFQCQEKKRTPARSHTYRSQKRGERKKLVSTRKVHLPHFFIRHLQGKEKWAWFGAAAQHIRLPASRLLLMRLDQGRSTGGFRAGGRLVSLWWKEYYPSGQGRPMVGLHLGAKCLVCVEPFPAADRQEDTSAKLLGQFILQYRMKNTPQVIPLKTLLWLFSSLAFIKMREISGF